MKNTVITVRETAVFDRDYVISGPVSDEILERLCERIERCNDVNSVYGIIQEFELEISSHDDEGCYEESEIEVLDVCDRDVEVAE